MDINQALATLDPKNDEHWTTDGLPKLDVISQLVGEQVKRQQVTDAAPEFNRDTAATPDDPTDREPEPTTEADALEARIEQLEGLMAEQRDIIKAAQVEFNRLEQLLTVAQAQLERLRPKATLQQNIQAYLARQHQIKQERADKVRQLQDAGINELIKSVGGAPIDQAMKNRKPARGTARPERPLKTGGQ